MHLRLLLCLITGFLFVWNAKGQCPTPNNDCPNTNVKFYLTTRTVSLVPVPDTVSGVSSAPFIDAPLKVLVHGTNGSKNDSPNLESIPRYLQAGNYNLLTIDYGILVPDVCIVLNNGVVVPVGTCLARMLKLIYAAFPSITPERTHIIGFSLGCQVSAAAANQLLPTKVARITALDPRTLWYETPFQAPIDQRLDATDAAFVDVIHTDGLLFGVKRPIGTVDFYVNKGYDQPGCVKFTTILFIPVIDPVATAICSHRRSAEVFAESITSSVGFWGRPCTYVGPLTVSNLCSPTSATATARMGEPASPTVTGTYQVTTKTSSPWANGP